MPERVWGEVATVLGAVGEGVTIQQKDGSLRFANDAAARLLGYETVDELMAVMPHEFLSLFAPHGEEEQPLSLDELPGAQVFRSGQPVERLLRVQPPAYGEPRWLRVNSQPLRDETGEIAFAVSLFRDVSEEIEAQKRLEFLVEVGDLMAHSLDYEAILHEVARLAVPKIADWCAVDLLQADGTIRRVAVSHVNPERVELAYELFRRYPPDPESELGLYAVLRSGQPELYAAIDDALLEAGARDAEHYTILRRLHLRAMIITPLIARGDTLGALTLAMAESERRYDDQDLALATELAQRAAVVVDNARLYRQVTRDNELLEARVARRTEQLADQVAALQATETALRHERDAFALLQEISATANEAGDVEVALRRVLELLAAHSGWPLGHVYLAAPDESDTLVPADIWYPPEAGHFATFRRLTMATSFRAGVGLPGRVVATKQPAWIADVHQDDDFVRAGQAADIGVRAGFAFPVVANQEVAAVVEFFSPVSVAPDAALLEVVAYIGNQLGRVFERDQAAEALQERSAQLAQAQRIARLGSWEWERSTNEVTWSDEMYDIFGVEPEAFQPSFEAVMAFYHPDDREYALEALRTKALGGRRPYELQYRIVRPDGAVRNIHSRSHPIVDESGEVVRLVGTWQDVTALKEAELLSRSLLELSYALNATLDLGELLHTLMQAAIRLTDAGGGLVGLNSAEGLVTRAFYQGNTAIPLDEIWPPGRGIPGWLLQHKRPYLTNDAPADPHTIPDFVRRFGLRSVLSTPILDGEGEMIAFFEVVNKKGGAGFTTADQEKLFGLSQIAAIAIQNARLFEQQRDFSRQIVTAQEEERQRLSRELHDSAGQLLTVLALQLSMLAKQVDEPERLSQGLDEAIEMTRSIHDEIRLVSQALRPPTLDLSGLNQALAGLCQEFSSRTELDIHYNGQEVPALSDATSITFYRFLQETLSNAARHAKAHTVEVQLRYEEGELTLSVEDDGVGFNVTERLPGNSVSGVGLLGLRERFELLDGHFFVDSRPGKGTRITGSYRLPS